MRVEDQLVNPQDAVVTVFTKHGLDNEQMLSVKREDVDFENSTITTGNRSFQVSDKSLSIIQQAIDQQVYFYDNAENDEAEDLLEGDHIIRGTAKKPASAKLVAERKEVIKRVFDAN